MRFLWGIGKAGGAYVTISRHTNTSIHSKSYYWQNTVHETDKSTANPTWGLIFESSKLKAQTSLLPRFSEKRSSSFELWARNSIRKCHPKWDRLYIFGSIVNHQSTITPVAESIFGPLSQTHMSKRVFMNEISSSALLDIQPTLFCVCGVDSFLPELEHL